MLLISGEIVIENYNWNVLVLEKFIELSCLCLYFLSLFGMCKKYLWLFESVFQNQNDFSLIDVSGESVLIGIAVSLVALIPNYLLIFLFRRAKVYNILKMYLSDLQHNDSNTEYPSRMMNEMSWC